MTGLWTAGRGGLQNHVGAGGFTEPRGGGGVYRTTWGRGGLQNHGGAAGLTLLFEGEVFCEVSALVVSSEEEQRVGMVDLQSPEIQDTLRTHTHTHTHTGEHQTS